MSEPQRILYFDCETTGLDPKVNGLWQVGGLISIDGIIKDRFSLEFSPREDEVIDDVALKMSGYSDEASLRAIKHTSEVGFKNFKAILEKHVDKFNRDQKFTLCGYHVGFDDGFLRQTFLKNHEKYYGSYITPYKLDIYSLTSLLMLTASWTYLI